MKTNESIQKNIRGYVQDVILGNIYSDKRMTLKWILQRFEEHDKKLSIDNLIELSSSYNAFLPQSPYYTDMKRIYKELGFKEVMSYSQFIFELPRIWYTALFRLIQEWEAESSETDLAY